MQHFLVEFIRSFGTDRRRSLTENGDVLSQFKRATRGAVLRDGIGLKSVHQSKFKRTDRGEERWARTCTESLHPSVPLRRDHREISLPALLRPILELVDPSWDHAWRQSKQNDEQVTISLMIFTFA